MSKIAVEKTRGSLVESLHRATIAVVDGSGNTFANLGDPTKVTYWRSAAKPLQVFPLLQRDGITKYNLTLAEVAVMCASHAAEDIHTQATRSILTKAGLNEELLACGTHPPVNREVRDRMIKNGESETEIHHNCSGKHSGMLLLAKLLDASYNEYWTEEHPVQREMVSIISQLTEVTEDNIWLAKDGCGVPVFGIPIDRMAYAYSLFGCSDLDSDLRYCFDTVQEAITTHPKMVAGTGRFNTKLMEVMGKKVVAKGGAQGVLSFGIPAHGLGVTIKVEDGDNKQTGPIAVEVLKQLDILTDREASELEREHYPQIKNARGEQVGETRPCFTLNFS